MGVTFILISCTQNSKVLNFERTPEGVLKRLKEGNDRFLEGKTLAPNRTEERRLETQKNKNHSLLSLLVPILEYLQP